MVDNGLTQSAWKDAADVENADDADAVGEDADDERRWPRARVEEGEVRPLYYYRYYYYCGQWTDAINQSIEHRHRRRHPQALSPEEGLGEPLPPEYHKELQVGRAPYIIIIIIIIIIISTIIIVEAMD